MTTFLLVIVFVIISLSVFFSFFVFIYVSTLICNDCRVAMHFNAPCIIIL